VVTPADTVCNPSQGVCDPEEVCTGTAGDACPEDELSGTETVCRDGGVCDPEEVCSGTAVGCPDDVLDPPGTSCGDDSDTVCTDPDTCDGEGSCLPNNEVCAFVTDSALCTFDVLPEKGTCDGGEADGAGCVIGDDEDACVTGGGDCVDSRQFRLLFTPDVQSQAHKLNAQNPGQTYYNAFVDGTPGDEETLLIGIPYPFVTQGARPVHVYDGAIVDSESGCFVPEELLASDDIQITIDDWITGVPADTRVICDDVCGPDGSGYCEFEVTFTIPASGLAYVNVHLEYGLKGKDTDANLCPDDPANADGGDRYTPDPEASAFGTYHAYIAETGELGLSDCKPYEFGHLSSGGLFLDGVESVNVFKKRTGVFGNASNAASPVAGWLLHLVNASGAIVEQTFSDEDGFYGLQYKHKGKTAPFTVYLFGPNGYELQQTVNLKANGFAEVSFDVSTNTATIEQGDGGGSTKPGGGKKP
jgi:hypothetical protein